MINYAYTILYVEDVAKSIEFYNESFGFETKFATPEYDYAELITGGTTIAFAQHQLAQSNFNAKYQKSHLSNAPLGIELGFVVEDVESALAKALKFGATLIQEAKEKPWGQTVAYIRDNNGFIIEICTEMSSE